MRVPSRAPAMVKIYLSDWLGKSAFKTALDIKFRSLPNSRTGTIVTCVRWSVLFPLCWCHPNQFLEVPAYLVDTRSRFTVGISWAFTAPRYSKSKEGGPCTSSMHNSEVSIALVTLCLLTGYSAAMVRRIRINEVHAPH